ncbi:eukaryotic and archaeal DNA primase, large subunit-domain-containing protein [Mortierella sp. GBAus27b]|nr:hypothetical protein BGX31_004666 [Mortierella sp. GBA43]KAI8361314.1 eukaryotic and archaeal DNA primase, large subunit-domain-containing protein [Mortierella sp. GBAus27b]
MFTQAQSNRKTRIQQGISSSSSSHPTRLSFYKDPPLLEISLEEFEQYALDRMQVLTALLTAQMRNLPHDQLEKTMNEAIKKYMPMNHDRSQLATTQLDDERKKDHISHFILRLAYSRSQELRSWFLRAECALFRYRFEKELQSEQIRFMETQNLSWKKVTDDDKRLLLNKLKACSFKPDTVEKETYFEVDFERVTGLVGRRQVYLQGGKAYVPMADQVVLVLDEFKERLSSALEATGRALPRMDEDDRLMPVLSHINKQYLGREFTTSAIAGEIQAQDVDNLKTHMPLCMEHLHNELRREKHLKHWGRMQYGLFLKGIGLSLEQALIFWQMAFEKLTPDQFSKQYAYNIRHSYGLEGKRTDYTPYSCRHIIQGNSPSSGDHHGCPFRHFGAVNLRATLAAHDVDEFDTEDIMGLVQGKHYQIACTRYYEVTRAKMLNMSSDSLKGGLSHDGQGNSSMLASQESIEHPNQFFEQSFTLMKSRQSQSESTQSADGQNGSGSGTLQPTIKGQYSYRRSNANYSSIPNHDMEL